VSKGKLYLLWCTSLRQVIFFFVAKGLRYGSDCVKSLLDWQCHEIFYFMLFLHESASLRPPIISLAPVQIVSEIREDIRNSRLTSGINDTGGGLTVHRRRFNCSPASTTPVVIMTNINSLSTPYIKHLKKKKHNLYVNSQKTLCSLFFLIQHWCRLTPVVNLSCKYFCEFFEKSRSGPIHEKT
jgi:hypothetical protein